MANALYPSFKERLLSGAIDWLNSPLRVVGVHHATDVPILATDASLADIAAGARVFTSGLLAGKTVTGGVFDADDLVLGVVSGASAESVIVYVDSGVEATSWLGVYIDTATGGLPIVPVGLGVFIVWPAGGIFAL